MHGAEHFCLRILPYIPYRQRQNCVFVSVSVYKQLSHKHTHTRAQHKHTRIVRPTHTHTRAFTRTHTHLHTSSRQPQRRYLLNSLFFQSRLRIICEFSAFIVIQLYRNQCELKLVFKVGGNAVSFIYTNVQINCTSQSREKQKKNNNNKIKCRTRTDRVVNANTVQSEITRQNGSGQHAKESERDQENPRASQRAAKICIRRQLPTDSTHMQVRICEILLCPTLVYSPWRWLKSASQKG